MDTPITKETLLLQLKAQDEIAARLQAENTQLQIKAEVLNQERRAISAEWALMTKEKERIAKAIVDIGSAP